ncbi:hypothetical protein [Streptomyces sp. NPDC050738]|uniref:hypothetical protein n=1 Tax=Streptomyces sp. NPDC050738 TaxID=3154744 RepID=UPI00341215BA
MSKQLNLRVPDEQYAALQAQAQARGTTVTSLALSLIGRDPRLVQPLGEAAQSLLSEEAIDAFDSAFGGEDEQTAAALRRGPSGQAA